MRFKSLTYSLVFSALSFTALTAQNHDTHGTPSHATPTQAPAHADTAHAPTATSHDAHAAGAHAGGCHDAFPKVDPTKKYNPTESILNHVADANEFHYFGHYSIPLPCILYSKTDGLKTFLSSKFHHGAIATDGYVSDHGTTKRVIDLANFPKGEVELSGHEADGEMHYFIHRTEDKTEHTFICYGDKLWEVEKGSGLVSPTSFYDFSITKNVASMLMAGFFLLWLFGSAAKKYKANPNAAPSGTQNLLEVLVLFIVDEIAKPMLGDKYMRFLPYLLTIFFFILTINLMGLIPFAPFGSNVTGNLAVTAALALIAFVVTNINGKADYWKHIFWMPNVPVAMKIFLMPIEVVGIFTKPISLMIRLFANITAGHIVVLSLVSLIFVFGNAGQSVVGASAGAFVGGLFTLFLSIIELLVAFIQAFIFTILTASYIGAAMEEHAHDDHH